MAGAGSPLRIGLGLCTGEAPPGSGRTVGDEYADALFYAGHAESLGYSSFWTSEHHGVSDGYLPSQLVLLAAVAAVTERIELATGVVIAPFHNPIRLAEDAAVADQVSKGRLKLGLGIGWRDEEFRMFGVRLAARVGCTEQMVGFLRQAFTGQRFSSSGPLGQFEDIQVTPEPFQEKGPRIVLGGFSAEGVRRAGRIADGFVRSRTADLSDVSGDVALASEGLAGSGRVESDFEFVLLQNVLLQGTAGPDRDRAVAEAAAYQLGAYAAWHDDDDTPGRGFSARPIGPERLQGGAVAGRPDQVAARLSAMVQAAGRFPVHLVVRLTYPGVDRSTGRALLDAFAREVMPAIVQTRPDLVTN